MADYEEDRGLGLLSTLRVVDSTSLSRKRRIRPIRASSKDMRINAEIPAADKEKLIKQLAGRASFLVTTTTPRGVRLTLIGVTHRRSDPTEAHSKHTPVVANGKTREDAIEKLWSTLLFPTPSGIQRSVWRVNYHPSLVSPKCIHTKYGFDAQNRRWMYRDRTVHIF